MTQQLKVKAAVLLTEQFTKSFKICKTLLCNDPLLKYPILGNHSYSCREEPFVQIDRFYSQVERSTKEKNNTLRWKKKCWPTLGLQIVTHL